MDMTSYLLSYLLFLCLLMLIVNDDKRSNKWYIHYSSSFDYETRKKSFLLKKIKPARKLIRVDDSIIYIPK